MTDELQNLSYDFLAKRGGAALKVEDRDGRVNFVQLTFSVNVPGHALTEDVRALLLSEARAALVRAYTSAVWNVEPST